MKIVYTYKDLSNKGGAERIICEKAGALAARGHEVHILCNHGGFHNPPAYPLSPSVQVHDLGIAMDEKGTSLTLPLRWLRYRRTLGNAIDRTLERINPDIVVVTPLWPYREFLRHSRHAVMESHTYRRTMVFGSRIGSFLNHRRISQLARHCTAVVALTHDDARAWTESGHVYVIPNFTEIKTLAPNSGPRRNAMLIGRLHPEKCVDEAIEAWSIVVKKHPDHVLDIYGDGQCEDRLQQQIKRLGLENNVRLLGVTDNPEAAYRSHDFMVLSSSHEAFSLVIIEAMACGCPVISYDCPVGPRNIITDGTDGMLVPFRGRPRLKRIAGMAEAICRMIENSTLRMGMAESAAQNIRRFDKERIIGQWESLFNSITGFRS